jgi:hypothetical protein
MIARRDLLALPAALAVPPISQAREAPPHGTFHRPLAQERPDRVYKALASGRLVSRRIRYLPYYTSGNTAEEALARMRAGFTRHALH